MLLQSCRMVRSPDLFQTARGAHSQESPVRLKQPQDSQILHPQIILLQQTPIGLFPVSLPHHVLLHSCFTIKNPQGSNPPEASNPQGASGTTEQTTNTDNKHQAWPSLSNLGSITSSLLFILSTVSSVPFSELPPSQGPPPVENLLFKSTETTEPDRELHRHRPQETSPLDGA